MLILLLNAERQKRDRRQRHLVILIVLLILVFALSSRYKYGIFTYSVLWAGSVWKSQSPYVVCLCVCPYLHQKPTCWRTEDFWSKVYRYYWHASIQF